MSKDISQWRAKNLNTRRTIKLKKIVTLLSPIVIVEIKIEVEASWVKLQVDILKKILIWIVESNKANFLTSKQLVVISLLSKKRKNKMTRFWARLSTTLIKKKSTIPINILKKS